MFVDNISDHFSFSDKTRKQNMCKWLLLGIIPSGIDCMYTKAEKCPTIKWESDCTHARTKILNARI